MFIIRHIDDHWVYSLVLCSQVLTMHLSCDSEEVKDGISLIMRRNLGNFCCHSGDGFIRKIFRLTTTAAREYLDQSLSNDFVFHASLIAILIQPAKQRIEAFLSRFQLLFHGKEVQWQSCHFNCPAMCRAVN